MISFALVIGLGGVMVAISINRATYSAFSRMVREGDVSIAKELSESLGEYYRSNGSWDGVESVIMKPYQHIFFQGRNMGRYQERPQGRGPMQSLHVVITDREGNVLVSTGEYSKGKTIPVDKGIPIYNGRNIEGYVLVGSMIGAGFLPFQEEFLKNSAKAIYLSLFTMIMTAIIVGFFLIRHITLPVIKLTRASKEVAEGNLDAVVRVRQNDELGELAESFNKMVSSLKKAEQWKKQIIADTAHELRTPLSLIQGRLEMMLEGIYPLNREEVDIVYNETLILTELIRELSELSNAEAGTVSINLRQCGAGELIEPVVESFMPAAEEKGITISSDIPEPDIKLNIDIQKMTQVLGNLVSNALRYTPEGGQIVLSVKTGHDGNTAVICVDDSGPGVEDSELDKIFDRFYRVDSHRNRNLGGSGLGLAISREIVRLHGGKIRAERSSKLGGLKVVISLPVMN